MGSLAYGSAGSTVAQPASTAAADSTSALAPRAQALEPSDRPGVGPGEAGIRGIAPRQPAVARVLRRGQDGIETLRDAESKDMLRIMRNAGRVTLAPLCVDLVPVNEVPVVERIGRECESGFLGDLAHAGRAQRFVGRGPAPGDRLPEPRVIGALEQQNVERARVDHDE